MRYLAIDHIIPNSLLALPIYDDNGKILLNANVSLSSHYLMRLSNMGYAGLYIYDEISEETTITELISEETRQKTLVALKTLNLDACRLFAHSIVDQLLKHPGVSVDMISLSSFDNYTYVHCLNVAVLAVTIGIGAGFSDEQLYSLSEAALLHDIGKIKIDLNLLNKKEKLSAKEMDTIREHPSEGYLMVKDNHFIKSVVKNAILFHHENEDGSGYPQGLISKQIHMYAKIIHVCDVYDALVSKRTYKDAMNPAEALEYLMSNCGTMFDIIYVKKLIEYVAPYPTGITVELSNGEKALITAQNKEFKTRPVITLLSSKQKVDLLKILNLTITKILT